MAQSLQRSAGAANTYQVSLEKSIGLTTAIGEVTRESGSVIGNSLKSIYSRITSIPKAVESLEGIGVAVRDSAGQMRSVENILDDVGAKWKDLSAEQQQNLGLQIAGRYQLSRFLIAMNEYDTVLKATETALNSQGSGYKENAEYLKSFEAQINMVKNAYMEAIIAARDSGLGDAMVTGLKIGLEFLNMLTKLIDTIGILPVVIGAGTLAFSALSDNVRGVVLSLGNASLSFARLGKDAVTSSLSSSTAVGNTTKAINVMSTSALVASTNMQKLSSSTIATTNASRILTNSQSAVTVATTTSAVATRGMSAALITAGSAAKGFGLSVASLVPGVAIFMAIGGVISLVTSKLMDASQANKELNKTIEENMRKNVDAVSINKETVDELLKSYAALTEKAKTGTLTSEEDLEYLQIQNELADLFPAIVSGIDSKGNSHLKTSEEIKKEIAESEKLLKIEREMLILNAKNEYANKIKNIQEYSSAVEKAANEVDLANKKAEHGINSKIREEGTKEAIEANIEKLKAQAKLAAANADLSGIMADVMGANFSLLPKKVSPVIKDSLDEIIKMINFDDANLDSGEIDKIINSISEIAPKLSEALATEKPEEFSKAVKILKEELSDNGIQADLTGLTYEQLSDILERHKKNMEESGKITDEAGNEIEETGEQAEEASDKLGKNADAMERLAGVSKSFLSEANDLLFTIESLGGMSELTASQTEDLANAQSALLAMYPEISGSALDLITQYEELSNVTMNKANSIAEATAVEQEMYAIEQQLLEMYPHLVAGDIDRVAMMDQVVNAIKAEVEANDILLAAISASRDGKLTAEEQMTLESLQKTNARIEIINGEISAIQKLVDAYASSYDSVKAAAEAGDESAIKALMRISVPTGALQVRQAELVSLTVQRTEATDILKKSEEVMTRTTTDGNKAIGERIKQQNKDAKAKDKANKSQKKLNDTTKKAIYLADSYAEALRKIDLEMSKLNETKERYNEWDKEHIAALKEEMALLEGKKALVQSQAADINNQINTGNHVQTGVVTYDTGTTSGAYTGKYAAEINKAAKTYNIDPFLIAAVIKAESGFVNKKTSPAGAQGLMQLMPGTASELGVTNVNDPAQNIMGGTKYLAQQLKAFGNDIRMALAAYNAGPGNVKKYGGIPPFKETKNYVNKVTADYAKSGQAGVTQAVQTAVSQSMANYYLKGNFRANQGIQKRSGKNGSYLHTGLDLIAKSGTDIKSVKSGVVKSKGKHATAGNYIDIRQEDGTVARYLHMKNQSTLEVGASVKAGDSVGKVGSTGRSTTPHLHLEIRDPKRAAAKGDLSPSYGLALDPKKYLQNQTSPVQVVSGGGKSGGTQGQVEANYASERDKLRGDLDKASQDLLALNSQIREQRRAIWEAGAAKAKHDKEETDKVLQNSDNRLKKHDPASKEYRNELEAQKNLHKNKLKYNQQEIEHWQKVQRSKGLTNQDQEYVKAKLHELGLEKNVIKFEIDDKAVQQLDSYAKRFDDRRKQIDREYEFEQTKLKGLVRGSEQYYKTLEKIASLTDRNLGIDEHESQKLRAAIKSGELYGENLKAAKERLEELRNSIAELKLEQQENIVILIEERKIGFDNKRNNRENEIQYEVTKLRDVDIASERYGKTLGKISTLMKDQQKTNREELAYLEKALNSKKLNAEASKEIRDRIWELKKEMMDLNYEIQSMDLEKLNNLMNIHARTISNLSYEYQRSQAIMSLYEEGQAEYTAELVAQKSILAKHAKAIYDQRNALQEEMLTMNLSLEAIEEKKKELQDLSLTYYGLIGSIKDTDKAIENSRKKMAEEAADKLIEAFKSYISEKRDMHMKSLDEELERENKRHQKVMDNYKKELEAFRKIIQEKINSIDDQEEERVYSKEINKLEEERIKVLDKINLLSLDDSLEAKAERKKLSEELSRIDEDLFEKRNAKEISDRKESLQKMLEDREEQSGKEEEIAEEQHQDSIDRIEKERSYWEKFYNDQLNDERKFAKMREDIIAGNFDSMSKEFQEYIKEMEETMPGLEDTLDGTMQAVGTSIRLNIIDSLREAIDLLEKLKIEQSKPETAPSTGNSGGGGGGHSEVKPLSNADLLVLTGKFYTERLAAQEKDPNRRTKIKDKAYELAQKGRESGSTISSSQGLDELLKNLPAVQRESFAKHLLGAGSQHVMSPELQDFVKKFGDQLMNSSMKLNTGGYIKKGSEGLAMLHEEEVVLNKNETKKLFNLLPTLENFQQLMNPIQLPKLSLPDIKGGSGDTFYQFDVRIDNLNGTKKDADNFMAEIDNRLKRKGLR